ADPSFGPRLAAAHCDLAVALAGRLGMAENVVGSLGQIYERYDGKGAPRGLRGAQIALPARLLHVAFRAETQRGLFGPGEAVEAVAERAGGELDPELARAFLGDAAALLGQVEAPSVWEQFLAAEPAPSARLDPARIGEVATAFAQYADVKSP